MYEEDQDNKVEDQASDNDGEPKATGIEQPAIKFSFTSAEKQSESRLEASSNKSGAGPQKLFNFNVVQQICQQNQIFNEKKKDEILEGQMQLVGEGQQPNAPIVALDNPYQDLDKVISKAKSQQKVSQMKKLKVGYNSGLGNKMMGPTDPTMMPFKLDKLPDNEPFSAGLNRKFGFMDQG